MKALGDHGEIPTMKRKGLINVSHSIRRLSLLPAITIRLPDGVLFQSEIESNGINAVSLSDLCIHTLSPLLMMLWSCFPPMALIGIYLTAVMAITSISVVMTVIVLNCHYKGPTAKQVPRWMRRYVIITSSPRPPVTLTRSTIISISSYLMLVEAEMKWISGWRDTWRGMRNEESPTKQATRPAESGSMDSSLNFCFIFPF